MKTINRTHLPAMITCIIWLLCGCSNEVGLPAGSTGVPLGVGSLRLEATPATRTDNPVTPPETYGTIAVFLTGQGGYTPVYGRTYNYLDEQDKWAPTDPVYVDNRTGKAVAVYDPYQVVSFGANSTVTTNTLQAQPFDTSKLWFYDNTSGAAVNSRNSMPDFSLKCAYSRLTFHLSRHTSYTSTCKVSRIGIKPSTGTFYTEARVDIVDGVLTGPPVEDYLIDTSSLPMGTTGLTTGVTDTSVDHLFPAQTLAEGAGLTFTLCVDGADYSATVSAATFNEIKVGVQYKVELEMIAGEIIVDRVSIANWVESDTDVDSEFD